MKKTLIFISVLIFSIVFLISYTNSGTTWKGGTCCQKFRVTTLGLPLKGCQVTITNPSPGPVLQCTPDANLECTICGLVVGTEYTVQANCGSRTGTATFVACTDDFVIINVP
jgi:hypothetical protein